jgi:hypothetical protein
MTDSRHKLRDAGPIFATSRDAQSCGGGAASVRNTGSTNTLSEVRAISASATRAWPPNGVGLDLMTWYEWIRKAAAPKDVNVTSRHAASVRCDARNSSVR